MLGLELVGPGLGSAPSAWNEETSWPEINGYVGKITPDWAGGGGGGGFGSGLGVACSGAALRGKPVVLDSLSHVGVMAAVVSLACLSLYGPPFHEPPPLFTVVEIPLH